MPLLLVFISLLLCLFHFVFYRNFVWFSVPKASNALFSYTYLLTPGSRVLLEKLTGSAASQEIPRIFGTRRFLTVLTRARHLSLYWANSIQSPQPPPTSWRSILILIYLLTAIGLSPGGSSTVHIYTQTIHRTKRNKPYIEQHNNFGRVRSVPRLG